MANVRPLSTDLQKKATAELHEDVARILDDIEAIKEWQRQKKYITARTDDQFILSFLRGCKFSLERTKAKIESFYTIRTLLPEIFKNRDPFRPEIQEILKLGVFLPILNQKDPTAPRVIIINCATFDPAKIKKEDLVKIKLMIADILMQEDDQMLVCGMQLLLELDGVRMPQVFPPALILKMVRYMEDCVPSRTKGIYLLNMPSIYEVSYSLFKSLLKEKLKRRLHVLNKNNFENMYKSIPKEDLPKEYGGDGPSLQELTDFWKKKVESYAEWFKEDETYRNNENLRPGKPRTTGDLFGIEGVEGSFRKLNVD